MLSMRFSWHPANAESNLRKHGISFATAASAFADPFALSVHDRIEGGAQPWPTLGLVEGHLLLLVAHTVAEDDDDGEYRPEAPRVGHEGDSTGRYRGLPYHIKKKKAT